MKTIPLLLLTLAVYNPCGHAAPAAVNPPATTGDVDATPVSTPSSPTLGYDDTPTVTPFFTPAVFLDNYYTRPRPVQQEPPGGNATPTPCVGVTRPYLSPGRPREAHLYIHD